MSAPLVFAFCQEAERQTVRDACEEAGIAPPWFEKVPRPLGVKPRLILLAIGPEGGAALARWVDSHGLNGVVGVGLAGVTAPWAERRSPLTQTLEESDAGRGAPFPLPLGPIEPLRAVVEMARVGEPCPCEHHPDPNRVCASCINRYARSLRLVIACAPDDGVCAACGGSGEERIEPPYVLELEIRDCATCGGTCGALSSADVALELSGERCPYDGIDDFQATTGGLTVIHYPTRAVLAEHGLAAVLKAVGS